MATTLLEEVSDIIDLSESLISPPPFPSSFYSNNLLNGVKFLKNIPPHSLSFTQSKEGGGDKAKLVGGQEMPLLGLGTWRLDGGEECEKAVREALEVGYRRIDTAFVYGTVCFFLFFCFFLFLFFFL